MFDRTIGLYHSAVLISVRLLDHACCTCKYGAKLCAVRSLRGSTHHVQLVMMEHYMPISAAVELAEYDYY